MSAEWRPVVGYEGIYEVSSEGQVRSLPRRGSRGGLIKPKLDKDGYKVFTLAAHGKRRTCRLHQAIAEAFLGPRPDWATLVRHINGVPNDNRVSNLAWGDNSLNQRDAVTHGTHRQTRKTHCPRGHEYTESNLYVYYQPRRDGTPSPRRQCRACNREKRRAA